IRFLAGVTVDSGLFDGDDDGDEHDAVRPAAAPRLPAPPPEPPPDPALDAILGPAAPDPATVRRALCPRLAEPLRFDRDSAVIAGEGAARLDRVAAAMHADPSIAQVVIEGHASTEGEPEHNFDLSLARSTAVWRYLVATGVSSYRLAIRGLG